MTRLFGRGELKLALLHVAADLGPTNGYSIMQGLADRVGGSWHPSPGAIYPALLALEDAGLLAGRDEAGARRYEITAAGKRKIAADPDVIEDVAVRARRAPAPPVTVGAVLDRLAASAPRRDKPVDAPTVARIEMLFEPVLTELWDLTAEEAL
ncbi:MAG: PadR family transcriptional regulator [Acidimicrobiales bacterium]